jgi:hypothetical protein
MPTPGHPTNTMEWSTELLLMGPRLVTTSFIVSRDLAVTAGLFPTHAAGIDDYLFLLALSRFGAIEWIDQPTAFYRIHPKSNYHRMSRTVPLLTSLAAWRWGAVVPSNANASMAPLSDQPNVSHQLELLVANAASEGTALSLRHAAAGALLIAPPKSLRHFARRYIRQYARARIRRQRANYR